MIVKRNDIFKKFNEAMIDEKNPGNNLISFLKIIIFLTEKNILTHK